MVRQGSRGRSPSSRIRPTPTSFPCRRYQADFQLTDADYADFKALLKKRNFSYDRQSEAMLKKLKEMAEFEGYMENASEEFAALEKKLQHNLDLELDRFAKDIKPLIAEEIVKRYYFEKGAVQETLKEACDFATA